MGRTDDRLAEYRRKRDPAKTDEPIPAAPPRGRRGTSTFVVQEHHASALHWDFRLERDGVLVSWALPKGVPPDPTVNHLAVQTEDHPLSYAAFEGSIPKGQYGGGRVSIWDHGTYLTEKWSEREIKVVLDGERTHGRFVLFRTGGKKWMIHRMDAPASPGWQAIPDKVEPMLATLGALPAKAEDDSWAYEMKWDGVRALCRVDGGRIRLVSRNGAEMSAAYPELRGLGEALGTTQVLLDGEIVSFDPSGRPNFGRLQKRMHVGRSAEASRLATAEPVVYLIFDVLHLDGRSTMALPYSQRRSILEGLDLAGPAWQVSPAFDGDGAKALQASQEQQLEGVLAKRRDSVYVPGARSRDWLKIKNIRAQEVVIGGWREGAGRRAGTIGALLLGIPDREGLAYVGKVGTGFTDAMLADLTSKLSRLSRQSSPFVDVPRPDAKDAHWVTPRLVGEVAFTEWTTDGRLRHPAWRGLRDDKTADQVRRES
jgi:bifunctional non-homologous end joining protein LigD